MNSHFEARKHPDNVKNVSEDDYYVFTDVGKVRSSQFREEVSKNRRAKEKKSSGEI